VTKQTVKAISTFTLLAVVVLSGAYLFSWSNLLAPLDAADDPLTNHLAIVEPPALALKKANVQAHNDANDPAAVTLTNWVYTGGGGSQGR
jgi:hypothetical protein